MVRTTSGSHRQLVRFTLTAVDWGNSVRTSSPQWFCPGRACKLSSAKTPSDLTPFNIPWPNSGNSLLKVVIAQKASVIVGLQPVIQVNVVKIGRYHFFAEFVSFRT